MRECVISAMRECVRSAMRECVITAMRECVISAVRKCVISAIREGVIVYRCSIVLLCMEKFLFLLRVSCNEDIALDLNFMSCAKTTDLVAQLPIFAYFCSLTTHWEVTMLASLSIASLP